MKKCQLILYGIACMLAANVFANDITTGAAPSTGTIADTAEQLWRSSKFVELEKYLTVVSQKYPKRVVSHVALAFVEEILHRDLKAAASILKPVADAVGAESITAPDEFAISVGNASMFYNNFASRPDASTKNEEFKRNLDLPKTRAFYGSKLPALLKMIRLSPNVDLP